jgi:hypothetical protein
MLEIIGVGRLCRRPRKRSASGKATSVTSISAGGRIVGEEAAKCVGTAIGIAKKTPNRAK